MIVDKNAPWNENLKDVCFVNSDFALFNISINFIIVRIDMIHNNQFIHLTRLHKSKNFGVLSKVVGHSRHSSL